MMSNNDLIRLLRDEYAVSAEEIDMAQRHAQRLQGSLHMVLWQFGILSLEQLDNLIGQMV
ncbi:MAG: DUF2949 domain-containing protein [Synechococcus sp.]